MSDRREQLLDILVDHVLRHGLDGASFRTLAAAAGVRHNTLTHHFGSRSELFAAIFERLAQRMAAPPVPQTSDRTRADRMRDTWERLTSDPFATVWPVFFEVLGAALRAPDQHAAFLHHVATDWSAQIADELIAEGRPQRDALALSTFLVASVRGLVIDASSGGDPARVQDAFELLIEVARTYLDDGITMQP